MSRSFINCSGESAQRIYVGLSGSKHSVLLQSTFLLLLSNLKLMLSLVPKPSYIKFSADIDGERGSLKKMCISMMMTIFYSAETSISCVSGRSSVLHGTVFLWFCWSSFLSHLWGLAVSWSKVQWVDFLITEVKVFIMGTEHFQTLNYGHEAQLLSLFLLNVSNLKRFFSSALAFIHRKSHVSSLVLSLPPHSSHLQYFLCDFVVVLPFKKLPFY